jgi:5-methylcytosine-specific restriction endonuclease McrA
MPNIPLKVCSAGGCSRISDRGQTQCPRHLDQTQTHTQTPPRRGRAISRQVVRGRKTRRNRERFYDTAVWKRIRVIVISEEPLCRRCKENDVYTAAEVVDHILPWQDNLDRPDLKTARDNLQSLCWSCHSSKTNKDQRGKTNV